MEEMMGEEGDLDRLSKIRTVAQEAKAVGETLRERRERVIATVATERLDLEPLAVQERAMNKYFKGEIGSSGIHGMVDALHAQEPVDGEIASLMRKHFPPDDRGQPSHEHLLSVYRRWKEAWDAGVKLHKIDPSDPDFSYYKAIANIRDTFDESTDELVRETAEPSDISWWIAKKSRMWADANRKSFFHEPRGTKSEGRLIQTKEYPTAARAALFWLVRRTVEATVGLDEAGKLKKPFVRLAVHGMSDRAHADIVLGGGNLKFREERWPASEAVLRWFAEGLAEKLADRNVEVRVAGGEGTRTPIVAIHRMGQEQAEVLSKTQEGAISKKFVDIDAERLSGAELGLEYFRGGHTFEVDDVEGRKRELIFPGFGKDFHTIQAEISKNLRNDPQAREALGRVFSELLHEFSDRFAAPGSS